MNIAVTKLFAFLTKKIFTPDFFGTVTIHVESGKPTRFTSERSYKVADLEG